jgi:TRAP-type C4-dicarboxylate transport system permease large subunit
MCNPKNPTSKELFFWSFTGICFSSVAATCTLVLLHTLLSPVSIISFFQVILYCTVEAATIIGVLPIFIEHIIYRHEFTEGFNALANMEQRLWKRNQL